MMSAAHNKRDDIQWLRALAIIAVILFHVFPKAFPYGYLGVDVFFVISGYLMTMILLKPGSKLPITEFYFRRIKRIFPTCLFVIVLTILFGYFLLLWSHFLMLLNEATWSIFFINNLPTILAQEKYFNLVSDIKFLLHTWSLGVEIQFYLLAPFLLFFINSRSKPLVWLISGILLSALMQLVIPSQEVSFGLVFCRIWQFFVGSVAYFYSTSHFDYKPLEINKLLRLNQFFYFMLWLLLIILCLCKYSLGDKKYIPAILRVTATTLSGFLLQKGSNHLIEIPSYVNTFLVYIGDASYSLYLVHWPVIIFFRYYGILFSFWSLPVIFMIVALGLIIHEMFEKQLIAYSWTVNGTVLAILYVGVLSVRFFSNPYPDPDVSLPLNVNSSTYDPIFANEMEAVSCDHPHYPCDEGIFDYIPRFGKYKPFCTYNLTASSNKTAVILGNSYAYMQSKGILSAIKQAKTKFQKVYLLIAFGCNPMTGSFDVVIAPQCRTADELHSRFLYFLRPDVIIFSALLSHIKELYPKAPPPEEIVKHPIYPQLQSLLRYANYTKKFIIIEPNPALTVGGKYKTPLSISEALIAGKDLSLYKKPIEAYERGDNNAWKWIQPVINECKNCKVITTRDIFCNAKECDFIDRMSMLGLYCDEGHISPRSSFKFIPKLKYAIDH